MNKRSITTLLIGLVLLTGVPGAVAAQENQPTTTPAPDQEEDDDSGIVDALNKLLEELESFTSDWDATLEEVLIAVLFHPFQVLAKHLIWAVSLLMTNTPTVHPNPAVEEIHQETLYVSYLLSGLVFAAAGLLHMIGPVLGISYQEVRKIIPRLIVALVFGTVSLPLLQFGVDLSDALTLAFAPNRMETSIQQLAGLSAGLALVYAINAVLLLAVAAVFVIRAVYIMFGAAISPLLALMWSIPRVKTYADTFIGGWFAALLIAPLDMLALHFSLALLNGTGASWTQMLSNWVLGIPSILLLIIIPVEVWSVSGTALRAAYGLGSTVKKRAPGRDDLSAYSFRFKSPEERRRLGMKRTLEGKDPVTGKKVDDTEGDRYYD